LTPWLDHLTNPVEDLSLRTVRTRLARFLLAQAEDPQPSHRWTQEEIAVHIGAVREMVGRTLRAFAASGLIRRQRGRVVVVDREGLERERGERPLRAYIATLDDVWREPERLPDGTVQPRSGDGDGTGRPARKMMWPGLRAWRRVDDFNTLTWCFEGLGRMPPGTQRGLDLGALSQETQAHSRRSAAQRRRRLAERAG